MSALYRRWRSRSFDDLLGQEHVVRTLRNAVRGNRIAHAYLFTGPRGTGKTSTARILARAVNCEHPVDGNPDNTCEACLAAQEGRALDVIEIDAASNTSVDNVRDLRERVAYAAGEGKYKVYIVDEVHRLSGAAFDAFLKTLEEPPPHVIFVFASTEPHKVPATIASRCQRFDFRRIPSSVVLARLEHVAQAEKLPASEGALALIARNANGSLRDALSLLDQAASYAEGEITEAHIRQSLGLADPILVARLTDHLLNGDPGPGLREAAAFIDAGGDPQQLLMQLVSFWRELLLQVTGAGPVSESLDPSLEPELKRQSKQLDQHRVLDVLRVLTTGEFSPRYDVPSSLAFEVAFVQAALTIGSRAPSRPVTSTPSVETRRAPSDSVRTPEAEPSSKASAPAPGTVPSPPVEAPSGELSGPVTSPVTGGEVADLETAWTNIVARMRAKSPSSQAVLRSGYLLKASTEELTVGFLHDFHAKFFTDIPKRRQLEEVVAEVLGSSYRVQCVRASKEEIEAVRGAGAVPEDDGFVEEVTERLRQYHAKQISNGNS